MTAIYKVDVAFETDTHTCPLCGKLPVNIMTQDRRQTVHKCENGHIWEFVQTSNGPEGGSVVGEINWWEFEEEE